MSIEGNIRPNPGAFQTSGITAVLCLITCVACTDDVGRGEPGIKSAKVNVVDGDTLDWTGKRWRLAAIDTPERHEKGYIEAKSRLNDLVKDGVRCVSNGEAAQGRVVGRCYNSSGADVAEEIVRAGLAAVCHNRKEAAGYAPAELEARTFRRGIWAEPRYARKAYCPPPTR